jgi:hypothetical protein
MAGDLADSEGFKALPEHLRSGRGVDFSGYTRPTLLRRGEGKTGNRNLKTGQLPVRFRCSRVRCRKAG